jgi:hypothetical protein
MFLQLRIDEAIFADLKAGQIKQSSDFLRQVVLQETLGSFPAGENIFEEEIMSVG